LSSRVPVDFGSFGARLFLFFFATKPIQLAEFFTKVEMIMIDPEKGNVKIIPYIESRGASCYSHPMIVSNI